MNKLAFRLKLWQLKIAFWRLERMEKRMLGFKVNAESKLRKQSKLRYFY